MTAEQKLRIIGYVRTLSSEPIDEDLLDFVVEDCVQRILLFLYEEKLETPLERIAAAMIAANYPRLLGFKQTGEVAREIHSVSDNGQSVTYSAQAKSSIISARDQEIFSGFEQILNRYRRIGVVS